MSSQAPMTSVTASSFGQVPRHSFPPARAPLPPPGCPCPIASVSSPARASALVSVAMAPHLLSELVGDGARQLGNRRRVDPAGSGNGHVELAGAPPGPAAEQNDPVTQ